MEKMRRSRTLLSNYMIVTGLTIYYASIVLAMTRLRWYLLLLVPGIAVLGLVYNEFLENRLVLFKDEYSYGPVSIAAMSITMGIIAHFLW